MFFRFLFLFTFYFSFSQDLIDFNISNQTYNIDQFHFLELNNIGDPILFLRPFQNDNFYFNHYSSKVREVDYFQDQYIYDKDSIYSYVSYENTYKEGGVLKSFLARPIGKYINMTFSYNNLSSLGFYSSQKNQYSILNTFVEYNNNSPYSCFFSFFSNNGFYNQNGGIKFYDSNLSPDLQITYLNSAETTIKKRILHFNQTYLINNKFRLKHDMLINSFKRTYIDNSNSSYHYSFTISDSLIEAPYENFIFFNRYGNSITINSRDLKLSINHNYYNTNDIVFNKIGDLDLTLSVTDFFVNNHNLDFKVGFYPFGYNKNNYIFDLKYQKKLHKLDNNFRILLLSKKPDFFIEHYNTGFNFNWEDFSSIRIASFAFSSSLVERQLSISLILNQYSNYLYFNNLVSPLQSDENILYFNFNLNKSWVFQKFIFKSIFCFQASNNQILSVPSFLFKQKIQYDYLLFKDVRLLSSCDFSIFSKYYMNSYFPLTDIFYQNTSEKTGMLPLFSADIYLSKKNFSLGFVIDNFTNIFFEDKYFIKDYIIPPSSLRLSIKWGFLD